MSQANACVRASDWTATEQWGEMMARQEPRSPWGAFYLSVAAEGRREWPRALWMVELALKKAPRSGILLMQKAAVLRATGDRLGAQKAYELAVQNDARLGEAHLALAQIYFDDRDFKRAEEHFRKAGDLLPDDAVPHLGLAQVLLTGKRKEAAIEALNRAVILDPNSVEVRRLHAQTLEGSPEHLSEALSSYRALKKLSKGAGKAPSEIDIESKIRELESRLVAQESASKVSLRNQEEP
jgi:tetratricopeptide (TPR) repeat protein